MRSSEIVGESVESKIYLVRGEKVMMDHDLATLYEVPTKRLKEQVKRNSHRFPSDFMFVLTDQELRNLRSQFATSSSQWGGHRVPPMAFTEQGVAMLSSILNSERAVAVNIAIVRTFVRLRQVRNSNEAFEKRMNQLETKYDQKFKVVFDAIRELMSNHVVPRKRIIGMGAENK